jgi:hypothetical protein
MGTLHEDQYTFLNISRSILLRMKNVLDINCRENQNTPEGKRPLGRRRIRWEDNIKMDIQEVGFVGMNWIELAQDSDSGGHL